MPAKDIFHNAVKRALEKESWVITDEQFLIRSGGVEIYIDIGAEKIIAAERNNEKIAIEVKSFLGNSKIYEFHAAIGQFINYHSILEDEQREHPTFACHCERNEVERGNPIDSLILKIMGLLRRSSNLRFVNYAMTTLLFLCKIKTGMLP
jgi:XisH protein